MLGWLSVLLVMMLAVGSDAGSPHDEVKAAASLLLPSLTYIYKIIKGN